MPENRLAGFCKRRGLLKTARGVTDSSSNSFTAAILINLQIQA